MRTREILLGLGFGVLVICVCSRDLYSQSRRGRAVRTSPQKAAQKNKSKPKTISFGVLNGKAINLVKPEYPPTASAVKVSGSVYIDVLIDVEGKVVSAKAGRGHPLLIPASIKAARASTFMPVTVEGNPMQAYGVIIYKYFPSSLNWLELGYAADSVETLINYLPTGFDEERKFLELTKSNPDTSESTLNSAWDIIVAKLAADEKARWLISVGRQIAILTRFHWNLERKNEAFNELRILLDTKPANISANLESRLVVLIDPVQQSVFSENLLNFTEKLFVLGN